MLQCLRHQVSRRPEPQPTLSRRQLLSVLQYDVSHNFDVWRPHLCTHLMTKHSI